MPIRDACNLSVVTTLFGPFFGRWDRRDLEIPWRSARERRAHNPQRTEFPRWGRHSSERYSPWYIHLTAWGPVAGSCEHGTEPQCSLTILRSSWLEHAPWSYIYFPKMQQQGQYRSLAFVSIFLSYIFSSSAFWFFSFLSICFSRLNPLPFVS